MTNLILLLFTWTTLYLLATRRAISGPISSISETYYLLEKKSKTGYLFAVFMWTVGVIIILMAALYNEQISNSGSLLFLSAAGAFFTGTAVRYKDDLTGIVHNIAASSIFIPMYIGASLIYQTWVPLYLFFVTIGVLYTTRKYIDNFIYVAEVVLIYEALLLLFIYAQA